MQLKVSYTVIALNASSDTCRMLPNTRCAVFARLIIFACLAFRAAAQRGLGFFTSVCTQNYWRRDEHTQFDRLFALL